MKINFCLLLLCQASATVPLHSVNKIRGIIAADDTFPAALADQSNLMMENFRIQMRLEEQQILLEETHERLLEVERLAAWSKEASRLMAHEMRNSLVVLGGFAQRLYKSILEGDTKKEEAAIIVKEVERMEIMLKSLLNSEKLRLPNLKMSNVNEIVKETLLFMNYELKKNNITYFTDLDSSLPEVMAKEYQTNKTYLFSLPEINLYFTYS